MSPARAVVVVALVAVGVTGCAHVPQRTLPDAGVAPPDAWSGPATPGEPVSGWIEEFDDPGLTEAVRRAIAGNQDLLAAGARLEAALAEARIAGANLLPLVGASADASRRGQTFVGFPIPGRENVPLTTISNSFGVSIDVSWEADLWGRLRAARGAALARLEATAADRQALALSIAAQTAKAWFAAVEARRQLELAEETLESWRRSLESVERRYRHGLVDALDVRLARSNVHTAEATLALRRDALERTLRQLHLLEGAYPAAGDATADSDLPDLATPVPAGLPAEIIARRPDLRAAERQLVAAGLQVAEARAARYPSIVLTATGGAISNQVRDVLRGDFKAWGLAAGILQPLFQGGALAANVDRTDALSREALHRFASAALQAFREVEDALASEQWLRDRRGALEEAARQAEAALELAQQQYEQGLVEYLAVLEAQRRALATSSQLLAVRREALENRIDLHLALGGDFARETDTNRSTGPTPVAEVSRR